MDTEQGPDATAQENARGYIFQKIQIDTATKIGAAVFVACYAIGLLEVNIYLLPYGVSDFNLLRARFVLTGLLVVGAIAVCTVCPFIAYVILRYVKSSMTKTKGGRVSRLSWIPALLAPLCLLVIPYEILHSTLRQTQHNSLIEYFVNSFFGLFVLVLIQFMRRDAIKGMMEMRSAAVTFGISIVVIVVYIIFVSTIFATYIFPRIPIQFGGARGQYVQFLIEHDSVQGISQLGIPIQGNTDSTKSVALLFTGDSFYLVEYNRHVFVLMTSIVTGIDTDPDPQ
jgi:hypothetical protein